MLILGIILVTFTLGIYQFFFKDSNHMVRLNVGNNQQPIKEKVVKTVNTQEISKFPGLNLRTETITTKDYTMSMSIPVTKSDKINQEIEKWINMRKNEFLDNIKDQKNSFISHLNIQVKTRSVKKDMYSLIFTADEYTGGANGTEFTRPFTVDINTGDFVHLSDIMQVDNQLMSLIKAEVYVDDERAEYIFPEHLDEALHDQKEIKWSINKENLTIYFDKYEVGAGAAGAFHIQIPIDKIAAYLDDHFAEQMNINKEKIIQQEKIQQESSSLKPNGKYIALTFDDGPSPKVTPRILDTLAKYNAKATFFMLGSQAEYYPNLVKKVAKEGHELANHSKGHPDLTKLNAKQITKEFSFTTDKIASVTGIKPKLIRPPYGAYNADVTNYAKVHGQSIILWSVDSLDWKNRNPQMINQIIKQDVTPGAIILMHDIHPTTADALPEVLRYLKSQGYEFVTVSELLAWKKEAGIGPFSGTRK